MKLLNENFKLVILVVLLGFSGLKVHSQPNFNITGFATQNGGTTGGQGGTTVTVSNYADLKSYAESSTTYIIKVNGTISNGSAGGQIKVGANKSIIGNGSTAFLSGIGISIASKNNIIIQNLRITLVGTSTPSSVNGGDCVAISGTSKNIWIDHCEIFNEDPAVQTNIDKYDGLIDIRDQTGFITISWCYLHDHHKGCLVGASDTDLYSDRKITYHHNYFKKVKYRIPMYRGATGHFFNNYIVGATDATEIRKGCCVRVEKNYYEALHYSIYTPTDAVGYTERIDNVEVSRTSRAYPGNCTASIPYNYSSWLTSTTNDVKTLVPQYAGVGKLSSTPAAATLTKHGGGSSSQTVAVGTAITSFYYSWENATGATVTGLPSGITAAISSPNVTISGTPTVAGTFNYTITTTGGSPNASVGGTFTVTGGSTSSLIYQAENAVINTGVTETKNAGYTGTGYANTDNAVGKYVEWTVTTTTAGSFSILFRSAAIDSRPADIYVNGTKVISALAFPNTGAYTTWANTATQNVTLINGVNKIKATSTTALGCANIDYLQVTGSGTLKSAKENTALASVTSVKIRPNPITENSSITLDLEKASSVSVKIINMQGKLSRNLYQGSLPQGSHDIKLQKQGLSKGIYFCKVTINGKAQNIKLLVTE